MNKITSVFAGLAVVATASIAPAFAQGELFNAPGSAFSFSFTGGGNTFNAFTSGTQSVGFNPTSGPSTTAGFSLVGQRTSGNLFSVTSLSITPSGGAAFSVPTPLSFIETTLPSGGVFFGSIGAASDGSSFSLTSPVPEASTVVSFGALLALGGLAVALRRKGVKNAV